MDAQVPTSWSTLFVFIVTTGFFSLLWTTAFEIAKSWWNRRSEAKYIAARTAVALEAYAIECWHNLQMADGHFSATRTAAIAALPTRPEIPTDADWRTVPADISVKVFSFMNETAIEERSAEYSRCFESNPFDFHTATQKQGKAAWALARELRRHYGLPLLDEQRKKLRELDGAT